MHKNALTLLEYRQDSKMGALRNRPPPRRKDLSRHLPAFPHLTCLAVPLDAKRRVVHKPGLWLDRRLRIGLHWICRELSLNRPTTHKDSCLPAPPKVVTAWYEYLSYRAGAVVRGGLITLIYRKMIKLPTNNLSESSAMALMGNDVETLVERFNALFVESWANTLTVAVATWMLAEQLGPVCVAPLIRGLGEQSRNQSLSYRVTDRLICSVSHALYISGKPDSGSPRDLSRSNPGAHQLHVCRPRVHQVCQDARLHRALHRTHCAKETTRSPYRKQIQAAERLLQRHRYVPVASIDCRGNPLRIMF